MQQVLLRVHPNAFPTVRPAGGRELPPTVRETLERLFAADLSQVRVHAAPAAALGDARAAAVGPDLFFAEGAYAPDTPEGLFLLAHEVAHVLQQRAAPLASCAAGALVVVDDPVLEAQADHAGRLALDAAFHGSSLGSVSLSPAGWGVSRGARVRLLQHKKPDPDGYGIGDLILAAVVFGVIWFLVYAARVALQRRNVAFQLQAQQRRQAAIVHNQNQPIAQLPVELIHYIAEYLDPASLGSFRGSGKFAFSALRSDSREGQITMRDVYANWLAQGGRPVRMTGWQLDSRRFARLVTWLRDNGNAGVAVQLEGAIDARYGRERDRLFQSFANRGERVTTFDLATALLASDYTEVFWEVLGGLHPRQLATLMADPEFVALFAPIPFRERLQFWK